MVLAELGGKLRQSLKKLQTASSIDEELITSILSEVSRALIESDVNVQTVVTVRNNIKATAMEYIDSKAPADSASQVEALRRTIQRSLIQELVRILSPAGKTPYRMKRNKPNVILFVGLQGAGKTTTIAKYAHYYQRRGFKTAMVCADTFRAGAFDQLKQNATKLRIPFYGSYTTADPVLIAQEGVQQFVSEKFELILVDTSGRHRQEASLLEEMQEISGVIRPDEIIFVMDATQGQAVYDQALAFHEAVDVGSVIVTKLDGHAKGGGALSAVAATQSPIAFLGSGEHLDDLEPFQAQGFVSKLLGFGDVKGLLEQLASVNKADGKSTQKELMDKMSKGVFTLRDVYKQLEGILKLGPMNKVMGMIPGVPEYLIPRSSEDDEATTRLKKFIYMMDSMTAAELDGKVNLHHFKTDPNIMNRINRIARGSGTHPEEVKMLLVCHKQFEDIVSKVGKSGMMNSAMQKQMADKMKRNPSEVMKRINQMDPKLLQQLGGSANVMNMLKNSGEGGIGSSMGALQTMLQREMGGGGMAPPPAMPQLPPGTELNQLMKMMQQAGIR
jgi:signal recognition particle subunit SRP54